MAIQWTEAMAVGVAEIDTQHKELFHRISQLMEACRGGAEATAVETGEVDKALRFLDEYVIIHFAMEETLMKTRAYPDYLTHKGQHTQFIQDLEELAGSYKTDPHGTKVVSKTLRILAEWLTKHILVTDRALGAFLTQTK